MGNKTKHTQVPAGTASISRGESNPIRTNSPDRGDIEKNDGTGNEYARDFEGNAFRTMALSPVPGLGGLWGAVDPRLTPWANRCRPYRGYRADGEQRRHVVGGGVVSFVMPTSHRVATAISPWREPWEQESIATPSPGRGDRRNTKHVLTTSDIIEPNDIRCRPCRGLIERVRTESHGSRRGLIVAAPAGAIARIENNVAMLLEEALGYGG